MALFSLCVRDILIDIRSDKLIYFSDFQVQCLFYTNISLKNILNILSYQFTYKNISHNLSGVKKMTKI